MSRRVAFDQLANPTIVEHDTIGGDWHVRIGGTTGDPFTFLTADEARTVAEAWTELAVQLAAHDSNTERSDELLDELLAVMTRNIKGGG